MDIQIFEEWIRKLDWNFRVEGRKNSLYSWQLASASVDFQLDHFQIVIYAEILHHSFIPTIHENLKPVFLLI